MVRSIFVRHYRPTESVIWATVDRFRATFTSVYNPHSQRRNTVSNEDAIATVGQSLEEDPNEDFVKRSWSYIMALQNPKSTSFGAERPSTNEMAINTYFRREVLFSDEAHSWLNGYLSKQSCCI